MTESITIRRCEPLRDVDALLQLFEMVFGQKIDRPFWEWKHQLHPAGEAVSLVAENTRGQVIAHFGHLPWKMRVAGRELIACQGVDLMVHRDYRRQGLAQELVTACRQQIFERGWHFAFGFPGHASYRILLQRLGSNTLMRLPYLFLPHGRLNAATRNTRSTNNKTFRFGKFRSPAIPKGIRIREIHAFDETVNALSQRTLGGNEVVTVRDSEYLNWRFFSHPKKRYTVLSVENEHELQGYCAIRGCEIFDLQTVDEPEVARGLLAQSFRLIRERGHAFIGSWISPGSPGHRLLKEAGFLDSRFHFKPRHLRRRQPVTVFPNPSSPVRETALEPRNWILNMSDTDFL